jgi:hypothetical protein
MLSRAIENAESFEKKGEKSQAFTPALAGSARVIPA